MTPKEKAEELVNEFYNYTMDVIILSTSLECSKQCALIAVDEIITALDEHQWQNKSVIEFYFYVKQEIEKL
jgi:hypothetical protein